MQGEVAGDVDDEPARAHQAETQDLHRAAVPERVQPVEVAEEVELLPPGHLARPEVPITEVDRHFPDPQPPPYHELECDLVTDRPQGARFRQRAPVDREEPRHGIGATGERQGQQGRDTRVQVAPPAPCAVDVTVRCVAAAEDHVAVAIVEGAQQIGDALGRMGEIGVHHHQPVEAGGSDPGENGAGQVPWRVAACLDADREGSRELRDERRAPIPGVVVGEDQLPLDPGAGEHGVHALREGGDVLGLPKRRRHDGDRPGLRW